MAQIGNFQSPFVVTLWDSVRALEGSPAEEGLQAGVGVQGYLGLISAAASAPLSIHPFLECCLLIR